MNGRGEVDPAVPAAGEKRWSGRGKKKTTLSEWS
jgi:hypothetical protein